MGVGARGAWAALVLGVLLMLALLKAAVDSAGLDGSLNTKNSMPSGNHSANPTENVTFVTSNYTSQSTTSSTKPLTTPLSPISKTATATARITTAGVSANRISTSSGSQNTTQATLATETIAHNSSATALSLSVTRNPGSKFDTGSFLGGIVLTLGVLSILYIGCRMYYSRRGIRYRTIDEHDAII
ncbi:porimin isoform X2 [Canis lupus dingo]|uniref:porimin isoform X2 n=1 Tax=Canis lupus dingo TaxID=286419 RepID=UPI0020C547C3|nr:porimin isoform X2 [Canis lupus dingo]